MEFPIAVLAFGGLLLLVGLVGGDLSYRGFVVPKVGPLPRFTTTLVGLGFIVLSVVVYALEVSVVNGRSGPEPVNAVVRESVRPVEPVEPVDPVVAEAIVVTVVDQLGAGQFEEQVDLAVDGSYVGTLYIDEFTPVSSLELPVQAAGPLSYELSVVGTDVDGASYWAQGSGTVEVRDGSTLYVSFDLDAGTALLVHGAAIS